MTDVLIYDKDYRLDAIEGDGLRWHSNHRLFADLVPGDRLWVVTSGKALNRSDANSGYLVAMWPVAQVVDNPGDEADHPADKYRYRVLVSEAEAIHLDEPVCVDHVIRGAGYDRTMSIGRFLRGPRRLSDEKIRQLRIAAGADLARNWLTGNKSSVNESPAAVGRKEQ